MKSSKYILGFLAIGGMVAALLSPPKFLAKDQLTEEEEITAVVPDDPFYHDAVEIRKAGEPDFLLKFTKSIDSLGFSQIV